MKYTYQSYKYRILFFIVSFLMFFLVSCKRDVVYENNSLSLEYAVSSAYDSVSGEIKEIPDDLSIYFYKKNALIFGDDYSEITYATKRVKLSSYILYHNIKISSIYTDEILPEYINIITINKKGQNIAEILKINDKEYLNFQNYIYELNYVKEIDDEDFNMARTNRKRFKAKPVYKPLKTTGAFIGLRDDTDGESKYFTLYIYSDYNAMSIYLYDGLSIPKGNGYLIAENYKNIEGGSLKDNLNFSFTQDFSIEPVLLPRLQKSFITQSSKIEYVSPYMISFKTRIKNFLNNTYKERYETYSLDRNGIRSKLSAEDIIGDNWVEKIKESIYIDYLSDVDYNILPDDIGIVRRNGYWILRTHLINNEIYDTIYTRINPIHLKQDNSMAFISMEQIKALYTSTVDYSASPEKTLAIVNAGSNIKVISLNASDLRIRDSFSLINRNFYLIMDHWLVGTEAEEHLFNILKSNMWFKVY